jgi:hypothetical protein
MFSAGRRRRETSTRPSVVETLMMGTCHQCGAVITDSVGVRDTCPSCQAYLHCCLNCKLYSPSSHNHCLSPTTEEVADVAKANFCEEFDFGTGQRGAKKGDDARDKFDRLFGN